MFLKEWGDKKNPAFKAYLIASLLFLAVLITGCSQPAENCSQQQLADLSGALAFAGNDQLEFVMTFVPRTDFVEGGQQHDDGQELEKTHCPSGQPNHTSHRRISSKFLLT